MAPYGRYLVVYFADIFHIQGSKWGDKGNKPKKMAVGSPNHRFGGYPIFLEFARPIEYF